MMKTDNIRGLRASVSMGIWSSSSGANRVLETAWNDQKGDEKIVLIFTITHRYVESRSIHGSRLTSLIVDSIMISSAG